MSVIASQINSLMRLTPENIKGDSQRVYNVEGVIKSSYDCFQMSRLMCRNSANLRWTLVTVVPSIAYCPPAASASMCTNRVPKNSSQQAMLSEVSHEAGIILCMGSANERPRYTVTWSLIGWAHTQNDLCEDVIVWECFLHHWPFVRGFYQIPLTTGQ